MSFFPRVFTPSRAAVLAVPLLRLWILGLRCRRVGYEQVQEFRAQEPLVFALWHDELFTPCLIHRQEGIIALVSASRDGEYLAQIMAKLGYCLARGSSSKQGLRAMREALLQISRQQRDVVFTVDGPKGPRHQAKEGAVYLACKAGLHLVPVRVYNSSKKVFHKAWDKFQLPWPGSVSTIYYGQPYKVQQGRLTSSLLQQEVSRLEEKLQCLLPEP
ncbi:MAG: lysophospholipid acyltransferase family protein [Desulfohalobiaceae bacterium]